MPETSTVVYRLMKPSSQASLERFQSPATSTSTGCWHLVLVLLEAADSPAEGCRPQPPQARQSAWHSVASSHDSHCTKQAILESREYTILLVRTSPPCRFGLFLGFVTPGTLCGILWGWDTGDGRGEEGKTTAPDFLSSPKLSLPIKRLHPRTLPQRRKNIPAKQLTRHQVPHVGSWSKSQELLGWSLTTDRKWDWDTG